MASVEAREVPRDGLLAGALERVDYGDAFRIRLEDDDARDAEALARSMLERAPGWIEALLRLRNLAVKPFGLKAGGPEPDPAERIGIFCVFARAPDEILLGQDDRHLDFRISVRRERRGPASFALLTTIVKFNGWLGRAYFVPVAPMHRIIVPVLVRQSVRRGQ